MYQKLPGIHYFLQIRAMRLLRPVTGCSTTEIPTACTYIGIFDTASNTSATWHNCTSYEGPGMYFTCTILGIIHWPLSQSMPPQVSLQKACFLHICMLFSVGRRLFLGFRVAGRAGAPSVHHNEKLSPGLFPWRVPSACQIVRAGRFFKGFRSVSPSRAGLV